MAIGTDVFVTPPTVPGDLGGGDGSPGHPFHLVAAGMAKPKLNGGGIVHLHDGHYVESVRLENFSEDGQEIVVRADGGGEVFIDSMLPEFLAPQVPEDHWVPVIPPEGPFLGEYYWGRQYMPDGADTASGLVNLGAFLDEPGHTRLVSYDRIEDLTATGQIGCTSPHPARTAGSWFQPPDISANPQSDVCPVESGFPLWQVLGSNQRRRCRRFYRPPPTCGPTRANSAASGSEGWNRDQTPAVNRCQPMSLGRPPALTETKEAVPTVGELIAGG
jgi:hypothetical protein